ncbi:MAG: hypothetical protein HS108_10170 [Planctomycetes bacterium]|jgi:hypothetical protein|nr:hypothetical protein [Planctomycetota bacterium]MCL4729353.1 hypothetical protein [Planctomycetota bacterium]
MRNILNLLLLACVAAGAGGLWAQPDIVVQRAAITINHNGSDNVGTSTGTGSFSVTYTILNQGSSTLTLTGGTPITGAGPYAVNYMINPPASSTIPASGSTTFVLDLDPNSDGHFNVRINIASDDPVKNPYTFIVWGDTGTRKKEEDDCSTGGTRGPGLVMLAGLLAALGVALRLRAFRA